MNNNEKDKEIDQINPGKSWDEKCEWTFLMLFSEPIKPSLEQKTNWQHLCLAVL